MSNHANMDYKRRLGRDEAIALRHIQSELLSGMVPDDEILSQIGLFITNQSMCRILFMLELYKQALDVPGVIFDFGTRYGQNMALFSTFRAIFDPYNFQRKIVGFDTFSGFPSFDNAADGDDGCIKKGNFSVPESYSSRLENIMAAHEKTLPLSHIRKFDIIAGDVTKTLDTYLSEHPETIISLAYFDMDLYAPTKHCLEKILPLMPKGAVLGFDELNHPLFPGETKAVHEVFRDEMSNLRLKRIPFASRPAYCILE